MIARAATLLFALSAAVAVLGLGAYAGGAFSPAQAAKGRSARVSDEQRYDKEPEAGEIAVGDALNVSGQPMQLSIFFDSSSVMSMVLASSLRTSAFCSRMKAWKSVSQSRTRLAGILSRWPRVPARMLST